MTWLSVLIAVKRVKTKHRTGLRDVPDAEGGLLHNELKQRNQALWHQSEREAYPGLQG